MAGSTKLVNSPSQAVVQNGTSHTQRTISNSAVDVINHTLSTDTKHVLIQFNGADVRVTFDGTTPTTGLGFLFVNGSTAYWPRALADGAKAIRTGGTDVIAEIQELNYIA